MTHTTSRSLARWPVRWMVLLVLIGALLSGCGGGTPAATAPTDIPTVEASPTSMPEATETPDASPRAETTDGSDRASAEEIQNEAGGFAIIPVADWTVAANTGASGFGGTVALLPEDADPEGNEGIFIVSGPAEVVMGETDPDSELDEATIGEFLDSFLADAESEDITISDRQEISIGGVDGLVVNLSGPDEEMGQMEGRIAVAQVDAGRMFLILGIGPADRWEQDRFDQVLESVRFFEPTEGDIDITDLLDATVLPDASATPEDGSTLPEDEPSGSGDTIFPLPDAVENMMSVPGSTDGINYQTTLSTEEVMDFYREALGAEGATERELLTVVTDGTFNLVFDGWPAANGQAVVIQGTPLDADRLNVNVRLEEV